MALTRLFLGMLFFFLFSPQVPAQELKKNNKEGEFVAKIQEAEEKARIDQVLAVQDRGEPVEAKSVIRKPLEATHGKITKQLETRPMKRMEDKSSMKPMSKKRVHSEEETRAAILKEVSERGATKQPPEKSRFKTDVIQKPLQVDGTINKK
ncbi:MAG: hypothetical protein ABH845_01785 [Candidatus Omnitrophota bacterium]